MQVQPMTSAHIDDILEMMKDFYASDAVATSGSREIFERDIAACTSDNPYLEGYVIVDEEDVAGYSMLAKSWSTEYGRPCFWIEDIYVRPKHRGKGMAHAIIEYIEHIHPGALLRLEAAPNNTDALRLYQEVGFGVMSDYLQLKRPPVS